MTQEPTATFARRLISLIYESFLLGAVIVVFFLLPQTLLGVLAGKSLPPGGLLAHFCVVLLIYFGWFWLNGGQTLAMKTWKIRVVDISGTPLRPLQAVLRYLAAWLSFGLAGLGLIWALFDKDGQFLHDRIADTRLIATIDSAPKKSKTPPTTF